VPLLFAFAKLPTPAFASKPQPLVAVLQVFPVLPSTFFQLLV
jgi:hypothetical protein